MSADYTYIIHFKGRVPASKANDNIGFKYTKSGSEDPDFDKLKLLAELIWIANAKLKNPFSKMFVKTSLQEFMGVVGNVLGCYDKKLIKVYLI